MSVDGGEDTPQSRAREDEQPGGHRLTTRRSLAVLLLVTFLAFLNYASLLSVVPMWATTGGAASVAVGATTGVMMGTTVLTQIAVPMLFKLFGLRDMLIIGSLLLGAPTPLYILSWEIGWVMGITAVRGVGFALVVVAGATLVADLAKAGKLSSSASLYGTAAALPNLGALAGGVWIADTWGFSVVFWIAGMTSLLAAIVSIALPGRARGAFTFASVAEVRHVAVPVGLFLLTAASFGAAMTFLPVSGPDAQEASLALLAASAALILGRLGAGFLGDQIGAGRLAGASVVITAVGLALISEALDGAPTLLLTGAALLGVGFGICQNDSFVATVQRLGPARSGTASTLWNMAYDGGLGLGAVALGWVIGTAGYASAFLVMALGTAAIGLFIQFAAPMKPR